MKENYAHVSTGNTVRNIINHPAFQGFGQFVLPLELGYDADMPLTRVGSLLPYHSNVDAGEVVNSINYMISKVNDGQTIFYEYYTDTQKLGIGTHAEGWLDDAVRFWENHMSP